jgi:flagellar basal body-associated protein FliL
MSTEIVLIVTITLLLITLLGVIFMHVSYVKLQDKKEKTYINALISKNVHEFTKAEIDQTLDVEVREEKLPNFVSEQELSDDEWFKILEKN